MSTTPAPPGLLRSVTVLGTGRLASLVLSFSVVTILMRRLGPEPFGIVAMAAGLMAIVNALGDAGVQDSLVTERELGPGRVGAAALVSTSLALALGLGALLTAPLVVRFYDQPRVAVPWLVSAGCVCCHLLAVVPQGLAQRSERFGLLAGARLTSMVVAAGVALPLAFSRTDVWPILAWQGLTPLLTLIVLLAAMRPRLARPDRAELSELLRFSRGVVGFTSLNVLTRNADDVIVGRFLGERALGYYGLCYRILTMPLGLVGDLFATVAQPRLARLVDDRAALGSQLAGLMGHVATLTTPICLGAALAGAELLEVVFGEAWLPALRPFQLLALCGIATAPGRLLGLCYTISRDTGRLARWALMTTPVILIGFLVGLPWGVTGVAASVTITFSALFPFSAVYAGRTLGLSPGELMAESARGIGRGFVAALPLALTCIVLRRWGSAPALVLGATVGVGALCELLLLRRVGRALRETLS